MSERLRAAKAGGLEVNVDIGCTGTSATAPVGLVERLERPLQSPGPVPLDERLQQAESRRQVGR
jgi:hypothetical protein